MLLSELAQYLESIGLGNYDPDGVTGDIFISSLPAAPDRLMALFPAGGASPDAKGPDSYPSVQIRVRGSRDPREPLIKAQQVLDALHGLSALSLPAGTYVVSCTADQSSPNYIGMDDSNRHEYTVNLSLMIYKPTVNRDY